MTVVKHGVSSDSPDRVLVDAGAVYLGFKDADNYGTLLGATRGGNSCEIARTIRRMEVDGAKGPIKGLRRIEEVVATIKANMLEMTAGNLRRALADAIFSSGTTTITSEDTGEGDGSSIEHDLGTLIHDCETDWDEQVVANVTTNPDSGEAQRGTNCQRIDVADGAGVGVLASDVISIAGSTLDNYTKMHLWIKTTIAVAASQLQLLIDDTADCASPTVTVNLPALEANAWTHVLVDADFSGCTGLTMISIGIGQVSDLGALSIYLDEIKGCGDQIEENSETITVNSVEQARGTDYTVDYDRGVLHFATAPTDGHAIVSTYKYVSGDAVIGGETTEANLYRIKDSAYVGNVALVGHLTGYSDPVICLITGAICDAGFNLSMASKDEAVLELTFTGHYTSSDLDTEPWSIEYPAS